MAVIPDAEIMTAIEKRAGEIAAGFPKPNADTLEMIDRATTHHALALICLTYRLPMPAYLQESERRTAQISYDAGNRASLPRPVPTERYVSGGAFS